jgi:hypothetical protein
MTCGGGMGEKILIFERNQNKISEAFPLHPTPAYSLGDCHCITPPPVQEVDLFFPFFVDGPATCWADPGDSLNPTRSA